MTIADLAACVRHAANGRAPQAARWILQRMGTLKDSDWVLVDILGQLIAYAVVDDGAIARFESDGPPIRLRLRNQSYCWLAPVNWPTLVPRGPTFSLRGLKALALALVEELSA